MQARGLPILLAGMEAPRNMGKAYTEEFRAVFADLAKEYDLVFYPFFLQGAALTDGMMQGDGIHRQRERRENNCDGHSAEG